MSGSKIRLGLVGVGKIALDQHIPAIQADSSFALVATASPGPASDSPALTGVAAHQSLAEMLAAEHGLDAVSICTPPEFRSAIAISALRAGLHVMLEKPPATAVSQVRAMQAEAAKAGCSLLAAWHSRETAAVDAARRWLAERRVLDGRVIWREDVRQWHPGQDWLLGPDGFGVFDPGINALSILTTILPGRLTLASADLSVPENRAAPMRAALSLQHDQDATVTCDFDILHAGHQEWTIAITTDAGQLTLADGGHRMTVAGERHAAESDTEYARLYTRFARLIDHGDSDVDIDPLVLVADALMLGTAQRIAPFEF